MYGRLESRRARAICAGALVALVAVAVFMPATAHAQTINIMNRSAYSWLRVSVANAMPQCFGPYKGGAIRADFRSVNDRVRVEVMHENCTPPVVHAKAFRLSHGTERTEIELRGDISCQEVRSGRGWMPCLNG